MQKVEQIKQKLALNFKDAKIRSLGNMIRFNVEELTDGPLISLGVMSVADACDITVKRSGTGLVVIVEV
jgi:hypothetical protein